MSPNCNLRLTGEAARYWAGVLEASALPSFGGVSSKVRNDICGGLFRLTWFMLVKML